MKNKGTSVVLSELSPEADVITKVSSSDAGNRLARNTNGRKPVRMDLTGMRFGRLTAIRPTEKRLNKKVVWECRCNCGNETMYDIENSGKLVYVSSTKLTRGHTRSCGRLVWLFPNRDFLCMTLLD